MLTHTYHIQVHTFESYKYTFRTNIYKIVSQMKWKLHNFQHTQSTHFTNSTEYFIIAIEKTTI